MRRIVSTVCGELSLELSKMINVDKALTDLMLT
jgi:hypothetical protein